MHRSFDFEVAPVRKSLSAGDVAFICLAGTIALTQISIAGSQILLAVTIAAYIRYRLHGPDSSFPIPPFAWPLLGLIFWTVIASVFSSHPMLNIIGMKKLILFSIPFIVPDIANAPRRRIRIYMGIFVAGAIGSTVCLVEYITAGVHDLDQRATGLMSHWMTFTSLSMLVFVALSAYVFSHGLRKAWWALPLGAITAAGIYVTQTRSTLVAAIVATAAIAAVLKRYRLFLILAMIAALTYFLSPAAFQDRFKAGFDPSHPHTRPRIELFKTGIRLIRAHPFLGVGPKSVEIEAPKYKSIDSRTDWTYIHLHNNFLQIAAERGIPGLMLWIWFMGQITLDSWKRLRLMRARAPAEPDRERFMVSGAAFGACIALLTGGLLEYNFGDSEVLMLFLFMVSAPYADEMAKLRNNADI